MPIYEYECESCDKRFELIQKFSDKPVKKCPKCGGTVHKILSAPALVFKGAGWYVTDYARKSPTGEAPTTGEPSAKSEKKDSGTATPAKAAPPKPSTEK